MSDDQQTFTLTTPTGEVIARGSMSAVMEHIPDSKARNAALEEAVHAAVEATKAEERLENARASSVQMLADGINQLGTRLDSFEKQRALSAKRAEAERQRRDQQRVQAMLDAGPDPDDPASMADEGELTIKHKPSPDEHGYPSGEPLRARPTEDDTEQDPSKPVLHYSKVPMSYIKKKDEDPLDPDNPGAVDVPPTGPEPGSPLHEGAPQVAQIPAISLNSAGE